MTDRPAPTVKGAPARLSLARLPTPLQSSARLGASLGLSLWWKRDDLTGVELSGNKIRKLEFLLAEAEAQNADTVITCGGVQSNHCRATALAAAQRGLRCVVLLRVADPSSPPPLEANSLMDRLAGAEIRYLSFDEYRRRDQVFAAVTAALEAEGRRVYAIPEGGSNALGAWGYIQAMAELRGQLPDNPVTIVYPAGSGGTGAGIELGLRLLGWGQARALGFAVCDDSQFFKQQIAAIALATAERWELDLRIPADEIEIIDRYMGPGYAQSTPEMLETIGRVARTDGIILDPVYTGKAFFGLEQEARSGRWPKSERSGSEDMRVVFLHTGGIFGLFPFAGDLTSAGSS
jgi:D-cysteine desulfhydrase